MGSTKKQINNKYNKANKKTATNNQWISTGVNPSDNRERRDGPGGENSKSR
ncbi:MAG: hypothetical protein U0L18_00720 [Acutalibacteraceae bacterium]|jgi:hypothetical protein|nr:hypothetical protein [Acutalibacteraceae bacterium]